MTRSKPLTVVRVLNWLPVGGVEHRVIELLPRLDPKTFRSHIVLLRERGALASLAEQAGIPVHLSPMKTRLSPPGLWRLARLFRQLGADIVHSHMYRSNTPATVAARLAGVPVIVAQVHNVDTWETRRQRNMDRFLMRWRSAVVAVSETVKRDIVNQLAVDPAKIRVIYNGVNTDAFSTSLENRAQERKREGLPLFATVAIQVARLVEQKNHRGLLKAFQRVAETVPDLVLLVVGDGPLRGALEEEARTLGLGQRVVFAGRRHDVPRLLALSDFSVLPSFKEGFSNVIVESLAAGLPLLVTDVGGNAEAVRDGVEGIVVKDPRNIDGLAKGLERLASDPILRETMSEKARERAQEFSVDEMAIQVARLYLDLMEESRAGKRVASRRR